MSNLHRLRWIDAQIRLKKYPNCSVIAEEFEISIRQVSRDIEYLRYSMNAPILYSPKENGYYYEDETFVLPSLFISREEKDTLNYLAEQYRGFGSRQSLRLAELFEKISYQNILIDGYQRGKTPLDVPLILIKTHELLTESIKTRQKVVITYLNAGGSKSKRIIHPYDWINRYGFHYVVAFCEKKGEIRLFRLDRIQNLSLLSDIFVIVENYNSQKFESEKAFNRREPFIASILFERSTDPINMEFYNVQEFIGSLLAKKHEFTIVAPNWLREALRKKLESLLYKNSI